MKPLKTRGRWLQVRAGTVRLPILLLLAGTLGAGIAPRYDVRLYRGTTSTDTFDLGVTLLPNMLVRQRLSPEIAQRYVVLEVAFFPKGGASVNIDHASFSLRNKDSGQIAYASRPEDKRRDKAGLPPRSVSVYPEASIGYETAGGYDPATGRRRGGVYTGAGVGVGIGPAPPSGPPVTNADLMDLELPDGATVKPVAGYLYFPVSSKKNAVYEVVFRGPQGAVTLSAGQR